jgi:hypothetical protein
MLFTFKRDEEGRERIYVGDVCVAELKAHDYDIQEEWLAKRDGVIVVAYFAGLMWHRSWGEHGMWCGAMLDAFNLSRSTNATHLLIKVNDDAQTIRVLVDGDDALVVVYTHDCGYHRSMRRGMTMALRGLKAERERMERMAYGDVSCS